MKHFKWNTSLKPKFPNVVEKFFGKKIDKDLKDNENISTVPSVNISDKDKAFEVNVALPGLDKKDINVEIKNNCLIISSEKQYDKEEKKKNWVRKEYGYASFQRVFQLPESADHEKVLAEMKKGVLTIKLGKKEGYTEHKRQISVE